MPTLGRTGWVATADSTVGGLVPANTLDSDVNTYWRSAIAAWPHHLILDLGSARTFDAVEFK